jgi:hypothetical protein
MTARLFGLLVTLALVGYAVLAVAESGGGEKVRCARGGWTRRLPWWTARREPRPVSSGGPRLAVGVGAPKPQRVGGAGWGIRPARTSSDDGGRGRP